MQFKKTEELKTGMRLARPIYNKNGVLLYERNFKLTEQGIASIRNFGLIGLFILEPAEPVPLMTKEDLEFERFETVCVFTIQEELNKIFTMHKVVKMQMLVNNIMRTYGHLDKKINFVQNLRSKEDYIYKNALNTAILATILCNKMNLKVEERLDTITAALLHNIGEMSLLLEFWEKEEPELTARDAIHNARVRGFDVIDDLFAATPAVRRICSQALKLLEGAEYGTEILDVNKAVMGAKVLAVAEIFDAMTAMQLNRAPESEIATLKYLFAHPESYDKSVVDALISSINILTPGISVELSTGEKALILAENQSDILRPMVLGFHDNTIMDLSNKALYDDVEIVDIMKTMDNRHILDTDSLKKQGFAVEEPEYVKVDEA